jgi:hypothetical protein
VSVTSKVRSGLLLLAIIPLLAMTAAWQQQNFPGASTLDQIGNPAVAKTFSIGSNTPLQFTDPGTFTSAAQNDDLVSTVTGGNSLAACNINTIVGGTFKFTDALAGIVCLPPGSTGVTNAYSNGVIGLAYIDNSGTGGQFGWVGGVGVYGSGWCAANNAHCWGANDATTDFASQTGNVEIANELDVSVSNNTTTGAAALASFRGNGQPTADGFPAFQIQAPAGTGTFTSGFNCNATSITSGSTYPFGCLVAGPRTSSGATTSMDAYFVARNGSAVLVPYALFSTVDGFGNAELTTNSALNVLQVGKLNIAATFTVATLPSAVTATAGTVVVVTDATTFTPGTCTGGGADTMLAVSNGTTWSCH